MGKVSLKGRKQAIEIFELFQDLESLIVTDGCFSYCHQGPMEAAGPDTIVDPAHTYVLLAW